MDDALDAEETCLNLFIQFDEEDDIQYSTEESSDIMDISEDEQSTPNFSEDDQNSLFNDNDHDGDLFQSDDEPDDIKLEFLDFDDEQPNSQLSSASILSPEPAAPPSPTPPLEFDRLANLPYEIVERSR